MANELAEVLTTSLGSYALYAHVASGGFGSVYFGRDLHNNRAVAIKRLHGHLAYQPAVVERFRREAQQLRGLQHPNIVQVLDDGTDTNGLPFIILQWVEGWTVSALLQQKGRFSVAEALEVASQVLAALEAAGRRGVVHRDIKPANLMVTPPPDRNVKVMDFGIAKDALADASSHNTQIGTIAYMAPEQFRQGPVDARADLYALGVTLCELLTGERPNAGFESVSPAALRELRPEIDPALAAVVCRALEPRSSDRFQSAADMRAALEPFVRGGVDLTMLTAARPVAPVENPDTAIAARQSQPEVEQLTAEARTRRSPSSTPGVERDEAAVVNAKADANAWPAFEGDRSGVAQAPPRRRFGGWLWVVGAAAALLVLVVGAQQVWVRQAEQSTVPAAAAATAVPAQTIVPTSVPPTSVPPTSVPLTTAPTAAPTAAPTLTSVPIAAPTATTGPPTPTSAPTAAPTPTSVPTAAPTATPSVDDLWLATLGEVDSTWSRDWPATISALEAFVAAHPDFAASQDKLYAARLFYADQLLSNGEGDAAAAQLAAADALLPQRPEARQALVALTPTAAPTAASAPQPAPQPKAPAPQPKPAPAPQPAPQPKPPAPQPKPPGPLNP